MSSATCSFAAPASRATAAAKRQISGRTAASVSSKASPALRGSGSGSSGAAAAFTAAARPPCRGSRTRSTRALQVSAASGGDAGTVAVAGATGLVGTKLVQDLLAAGYSVRVLTRNPAAAKNKLPFPGIEFVAPPQWGTAVCGTAAVVNLAGAPAEGAAGGLGALIMQPRQCSCVAFHRMFCRASRSRSLPQPSLTAPLPPTRPVLPSLQASPSLPGGLLPSKLRSSAAAWRSPPSWQRPSTPACPPSAPQ